MSVATCINLTPWPIMISAQGWGFASSYFSGGNWYQASFWGLLFWAISWLGFYQELSPVEGFIILPINLILWALFAMALTANLPIKMKHGWNDWVDVQSGRPHSLIHTCVYWGIVFTYIGIVGTIGVFSACVDYITRTTEEQVSLFLLIFGSIMLIFSLCFLVYKAYGVILTPSSLPVSQPPSRPHIDMYKMSAGQPPFPFFHADTDTDTGTGDLIKERRVLTSVWWKRQMYGQIITGARILLTVLYANLVDTIGLNMGISAAIYLGSLIIYYGLTICLIKKWIAEDQKARYELTGKAAHAEKKTEIIKFIGVFVIVDLLGAVKFIVVSSITPHIVFGLYSSLVYALVCLACLLIYNMDKTRRRRRIQQKRMVAAYQNSY